MNWRNVAIVAVIVLPLIFLFAWGFSVDPHEVPSVMAGRAAPDCELRNVDGTRTSLREFRDRPVVVNFWSTWCVPCKAEHPALLAAARELQGKAQFIGVVYQDEPAAVRRYLATHGQGYPTFLDPQSRCSIDFGVAGVPETFFIDGNGIVRHKEVGPVNAALINEVVQLMLGGTAP